MEIIQLTIGQETNKQHTLCRYGIMVYGIDIWRKEPGKISTSDGMIDDERTETI